ncbi:choline-sulfatase [Pelagibius sp. Alg239-R121]|uniref:choline-sulfatase n=1 Tax=Pelagibius sp. Alg239-R121 TaxID=2993448 RepID=UPI0024A6EE93|nr:choline-sulfatase [Pelagibius sp. Alg239-R121]
MPKTPPNILIIMADQLSPQFTAAYGHPLVKTPNIDALARRGTRFDAAYCNTPLCAPARYSFMSGQLATRIEAYDNACEFPSSIPTFAHYLKQMGYHCCLSGKMHFVGPDQLHGFDERLTTDIYPSDFAWTPNWEAPAERIDKWYHNMDSVLEAGVAATTFQIEYDDEVSFFAKRKIFDLARNGTQPFCLVASFIHPHDPYVARQEWWDHYQASDIDLPKATIDYDAQDAFSKRLMDGIQASETEVTEAQLRNARHAYYANTTYFDSKVGELVTALKQAGMFENTVIIITADHGDMLGERSLWYKMNFFEHSARVPLILSGTGVRQGVLSNACSLVDILPTLLDIASEGGIPQPELAQVIDGRSLWPLAKGDQDPNGRGIIDEALGEYCAEMTSHPVFMIRRGRHKYIHCDTDPPLLFDLVEDRDERINLACDPAYDGLAKQFLKAVQERWHSEKIRRDVILSQKRRRTIVASTAGRPAPSWDFNPPRDAANEYVRNHMDWTVAAVKTRFPPLVPGSDGIKVVKEPT